MMHLTAIQKREIDLDTLRDNLTEAFHEIECLVPYHNLKIIDAGFSIQNGTMIKTIQLVSKD